MLEDGKEQSCFVGLYRLYNHLRQIKLKEGPMQGKRTIVLSVMLSTMLLLCFPTWALCQDQATPLDVKALLGSWQLVRYEVVKADNQVFLPYGSSLSGILVYLGNGRMFAAWGNQDRPRAKDPQRPTQAELAMRLKGFDAYWGTFEVDAVRRVVIHHVEGCITPEAIGTDRIRNVVVDGDNLILMTSPQPCGGWFKDQCAEGERVRLKLTWRKNP